MENKELSIQEKTIVSLLKENSPLTIAQMNELSGDVVIKPGHIVGASRKKLIVKDGEAEVVRKVKSKVNTYEFVTDAVMEKDGKPCNYTDGEKEVLAFASKMDGAFTLAQLAEAMGLEKLSSGRITGLTKKGNIAKADQIEVEGESKSLVNTYRLVD